MSHLEQSRESGVVLMFAMVTMLVTALFVLAHANTDKIRTEELMRSFDRFRAQGIAEAGIEYAYYHFMFNGVDWAKIGPVPIGDGSVSFSITPSGPNYDIISHGTCNEQTFKYLSRTHLNRDVVRITDTFFAGSDFIVEDSSLAWGGTLKHVGSSVVTESVLVGDVSNATAIPMFGLDTADLSNNATTTLPPHSTVSDLSPVGVTYCAGDLHIANSFKSNGVLVIDGDMTFDGSGSAATIIGDGPTAILVRGTLTIRNFTDFSITGTIFALDGVTFENIDHLQLLGSVVTNGDLTFNAVEMEAEFDPSITSTPPEEVTGGERGRTLAELWRIPHNSATDPSIASDAASGSPPPDDDLTIFGDLHDILDGSADETDSAADSSGASSPGRRSAKPHPRVSSSRPPGHIADRIPFC